MSKLLRYHDYNEQWPIEFEKIKTFLDSKLINLHKEIHHVGSTSVKGLGAKPIIDIDIEFEDNLELIIQVLEENGYVYQGEKGVIGRHAFRRSDDLFYEHHLYAIHSNGEELKKHIQFRDCLRMSKSYRTKYQELKKRLIKENNKDRQLYVDSKSDLVTHITKRSVFMKSIVFAGGCFWGVEAYFKLIEGVTDTEVGYIGADGETTYQQVCAGSGHTEAVHIIYDEDVVSLKKLMDHLFNIIDPTSINKQGPDIGVQYRTGVYNYHPSDLDFIKNYIQVRQREYKKPIVLELITNLEFFKAEDYHQDYLDKNANGYCHVNLESHKNVE